MTTWQFWMLIGAIVFMTVVLDMGLTAIVRRLDRIHADMPTRR